MLTRKQIEKLALKNRVSLFTQERDYIQAVYLSLLYSKTMNFLFKGGTSFEWLMGLGGTLRIWILTRTLGKMRLTEHWKLQQRSLNILASSLDHIFAEKVRALLVRGMARDLYDLWFLIERGVKPDLELINSKLSLYDKIYSQEEMNKRISQLEKGWNKDLKPLLGAFVPYDVAAKRVVDGLMSHANPGNE